MAHHIRFWDLLFILRIYLLRGWTAENQNQITNTTLQNFWANGITEFHSRQKPTMRSVVFIWKTMSTQGLHRRNCELRAMKYSRRRQQVKTIAMSTKLWRRVRGEIGTAVWNVKNDVWYSQPRPLCRTTTAAMNRRRTYPPPHWKCPHIHNIERFRHHIAQAQAEHILRFLQTGLKIPNSSLKLMLIIDKQDCTWKYNVQH
jgi:hypothetical protein